MPDDILIATRLLNRCDSMSFTIFNKRLQDMKAYRVHLQAINLQTERMEWHSVAYYI